MDIVTLIGVLLVVGVILWAINKWAPIDDNIKTIINAIVICFVLIWLAQTLGLIALLHTIRI